MKKCNRCQEDKPEECFNKHSSRKDGLQSFCKSCQSIKIKAYYKNNTQRVKDLVKLNKPKYKKPIQKYIIDLLLNSSCLYCGEDNILCLDFHHRNQEDKVATVSKLVDTLSVAAAKIEIAKCDILCANCHRIETHKQINSYKWKYIVGL